MTEPTPTSGADTPRPDGRTQASDPVPSFVDWLIGGASGVVGLLVTVLGVGLFLEVDRTTIAEAIRAESTQVSGITPAEAIEAGGPFVDWLTAGITGTGLTLMLLAAAFVQKRRRTRRRVARDGGTTATFWASAVYGAVLTVVISFVPGSAIGGGAAAAYLHDESHVRIGALAGVIGWAVTVPLLLGVAVGFLAGAAAIGELVAGTLLAGLIVGAELVALVVVVGFGALGGYVVKRFF